MEVRILFLLLILNRNTVMKTIKSSWLQRFIIMSLIALFALVVFANSIASQSFPAVIAPLPKSSIGFVTRTGSQLMLNGRPFRFAGANMHWLALDDSTTYPSQFR